MTTTQPTCMTCVHRKPGDPAEPFSNQFDDCTLSPTWQMIAAPKLHYCASYKPDVLSAVRDAAEHLRDEASDHILEIVEHLRSTLPGKQVTIHPIPEQFTEPTGYEYLVKTLAVLVADHGSVEVQRVLSMLAVPVGDED